MKGIILIIDGNYQLMKTVFPLHQANRLHGELFHTLKNTFDKQMGLFPFKKVFYVSDSRQSWRKQINQTYKANRSKKEEIDWNFVFECYTEFKHKVGNSKCTHLEYTGLEGDDWIAGLVKKANAMGYSCMIISSDQDLLQLLEWRLDPDIINFLYRDNLLQEKVWFPKGYSIFLNKLYKTPIDLFELDWRQDFYELIKKMSKYTTEEVNPNEALFCKVISGDSSDNISSVLVTMTKTGKPRGIGDSGALKIWNKYLESADENVDYSNIEILEHMTQLVLEYKKVEANPQNHSNVFNKINENIKLIKLNEEYMPIEYRRVLNENLNNVLL